MGRTGNEAGVCADPARRLLACQTGMKAVTVSYQRGGHPGEVVRPGSYRGYERVDPVAPWLTSPEWAEL